MPTTKTAAALAAQTAAREAIAARDQIENCCSPEWRAAHAEAQRLCLESLDAFNAAYKSGELARPYWA